MADPTVLVFSNPHHRNPDIKARTFVINQIGSSVRTRSHHGVVPVYRALRVTAENDGERDTNEMLVCVKFVPLGDSQFDDFRTSARDSQTVDSDFVVKLIDHFDFDSNLYVATFEYMDRGSMLEVAMHRFAGKMAEKEVVYVIYRVLRAMEVAHQVQKPLGNICSTQVLLNSKGEIKVAYGASSAQFYGDASIVGEDWPFLPPSQVGEVKPPEFSKAPSDLDVFKADIWRLGVLALELAFCGLRVADEENLLEAIGDILKLKDKGKAINGDPFLKAKTAAKKKNLLTKIGDHIHVPHPNPKLTQWFNPLKTPPTKKLSPESVKRHDLSRKFTEMVIRCLDPDPQKRPSVYKLLELKIFKPVSSGSDGKFFLRKY